VRAKVDLGPISQVMAGGNGRLQAIIAGSSTTCTAADSDMALTHTLLLHSVVSVHPYLPTPEALLGVLQRAMGHTSEPESWRVKAAPKLTNRTKMNPTPN
jgi:hypothetical protein